MSTATDAPRLTIIEKLEQFGHETLTDLEHAACRLVGDITMASTALDELEATSPLVRVAIDAGIASANAHGVPLTLLANAGEAVLALAKELAASLSQPAPAASPAAT